ncbi:septum site-determining protein MinC [Algiphilus sp. W345]|uniref:Probable septum site-determining protein MinC n=1 Tax=Banduia mediterranea TaxID=3075609 RepID=A0ABU2WML4_9GAMM|nr:septum site-determining protein MinC [Algiphilus sp. W345]MDT0499118.1 septum site-determining protein MinC [Algiphilus sp. W345]
MASKHAALELKGQMLSVTHIKLRAADTAAATAQLQEWARQMPDSVAGMPVVLDAAEPTDLAALLTPMREIGLQPLAVLEGPLGEAARELGLAVLDETSLGAGRAPRAAPPPPAPAAHKPARMALEPVRSGQQIYAEGADVVVVNSVSVGAEVIADGCVHVYGSLRGRAIAGARGDENARIFCRHFEAELVAVAGVYAVAEQMQGNLRGKAVQVFLDRGKLMIEKLD